MVNRRQYTVGDFRVAVERVGASVSLVADELGCSRSTVYAYRRRMPEIEALFDGGVNPDAEKDKHKVYPHGKFVDAIRESNGILADVAKAVGCSYELARQRIKEDEELSALMEDAAHSLVDLAENQIVKCVKSADEKIKLGAAKFILSTRGKDRGWSSRTEITGADGEALFSSEIVEMMRVLGMNPRDVVAQFEMMVRAEYAKVALTPNPSPIKGEGL